MKPMSDKTLTPMETPTPEEKQYQLIIKKEAQFEWHEILKDGKTWFIFDEGISANNPKLDTTMANTADHFDNIATRCSDAYKF